MTVIYRTDGPWGSGLGTNLTAAQVDDNFWDLVSRLVTLETQIKATGVLTLTGNANAAETVTIGTRVYTWRAAVGAIADEVKIGASAAISIDNLIAAIDGDAGAGTLYGTGTAANSLIIAGHGAGTSMAAEARVAGDFGNTIATAETMVNGSWGSPTLTGGAGKGADNIESVQVIGSQMTIYTQSGTAFGPFTLPIAVFHWRGNWAPSEDYSELDFVFVPFVGVYMVQVTHTSPLDFDPSFTVGGQTVYFKLFAVPGQAAMNWRGEYGPGETYVQDDVFDVANDGAYVTLIDHTSADPFDPLAIDPASANSLYERLWDAPGTSTDDNTDLKDSVKCASIGNLVLSGEQTIDTFVTSASRVLAKNQTIKKDNGIWVTAAGAWARATDADEDDEVHSGMLVFVESGDVNDGRMYVLKTPNPIVVGTTPLVFTQSNITSGTRPNLFITAAGNTDISADADHQKRTLMMNSASAQSLTFGDDTGIGNNREVWVMPINSGVVTIIGGGSTTIQKPVGVPLTLTKFVLYKFRKQAAHLWQMLGPSDHSDAVINDSAISGAYVSDALEQLESEIVSGGGLPSKVSKGGDTMTGPLVVPNGTLALPGLGVGGATTGLYISGTELRIGVQADASARFNELGIGVDASPSAAVAASGTLTFTGNAVAAETVTISGRIYTWRAAVGATANEVLIGATTADSVNNLIAAINLGAGSGTLYGSSTPANTQVSAALGAGTSMNVTALVAGYAADLFRTTETMTNAAWTKEALTGGFDLYPFFSANGGKLGGLTSTARLTWFDNVGRMVTQYDDNSAVQHWTLNNFGLTNINQGANILFQLGTGGVFGQVAARIKIWSLADWSVLANRTSMMIFHTTLAGVDTETVRFDAGNGLSMYGANVTIDLDRLIRLRSYTIAGSPVASTKADKMIAQSDAPGGASQAYSDGSTWLNPIYRNRTTNITVGYTTTAFDIGTVTTGTTTPAPANGNMQKMVNGGASTLAAPSATGDYMLCVQVTNNASAGLLTITGVTKQTGDALTTTNTSKFLLYFTKFGSNVHLNVVALQ